MSKEAVEEVSEAPLATPGREACRRVCESGETDKEGVTDGLREQWFVACTERELLRGKPLGVRILGIGIVLFREQDGRIAALIDQCVHRGTRLSAGRLDGGQLVCPYHGWRYDGQGQVVHVPSIDGMRASTTATSNSYPFRQRALPVQALDGLVWVYLGNGDASARPVFRMPMREQAPWQSYYMINTFDGDISMLAQNFMDVPHTVFVHSGIFRSSRGKLMEATVATTPDSVEVTYHDGEDSIGFGLDWLTNPDGVALEHTDRFIAPNVTRCEYRWGNRSGFLIVSQITPIDARRSRVYTYIAYRFRLPRWLLRVLRPALHLYTHLVIQQDVRIMRSHREGLDNAPDFRPHNVRADVVHVAIDRLIDAVKRGERVNAAHLSENMVRFEL
ncbi:3-phenylpropionate/cinnamic acid dioxygenase subunit alpha [Paraburkholderia caffeinitolerans]|uniref:3-phenylpropionate/cinnamic acid dioxygenase subunit alpha n=1 Tax=Paraburkholderia caffeinitolerans TaxID=1723730 RepID=A0A6J5H0I2_9BURK|nr:aromatic ring-hydroxylating dioxygenase subunit alpha [Paraburkholderia caffeinitolerans]CAB3809108.1 3-phenylpropionate/cinnamic acid dioxygenase subunit alpha [Paraburkholderia caffeinitolerans]